jgi:hypothetical protein
VNNNEQRFEFAKMDYQRLATQEQALMDRRPEIWPKFVAIVAVPSGYFGIFGLQASLPLLCLITFFLACLSIEMKHDEQVLRYDVRKQMKLLAREWEYENHDSKYKDNTRWWGGYYKYGRLCAFVLVQVIASCISCWYLATTGQPVFCIALCLANLALIGFTAWCLL